MSWKCLLCGYVHRGDAPPGECPLCGTSAENFMQAEEAKPAVSPAQTVKWRCKVCGYIHQGETPPEVCPVCGVDASQFEKVAQNNDTLFQALNQISYGLYIITAHFDGADNGQTANTSFQITDQPLQVAVASNKNNYTHELIDKNKKFALSVLNQDGIPYVRNFGFRTGRGVNKFEGIKVHRGPSGILMLDDAVATLEAEVVNQMDAGTHTLFLGRITNAEVLSDREPMTYAYYRKNK